MSNLLLVYISKAKYTFSEKELEELLDKARKNNKPLGITGLLIYAGNRFLQVLEGDPVVVNDLVEKIKKDPRHSHLVVVSSELTEKRHFADWSMGFQHTNLETINGALPGFVDAFDDSGELVIDNRIAKDFKAHIIIGGFKKILSQEAAMHSS